MNSGWTKAPNSLIAAAGLTSLDKLTMMTLLMCAGRGESCFPSEAKIAEWIGVSIRHVRRSLAYLSGKKIDKRPPQTPLIQVRRAGRGNSNRYVIGSDYDRTLMSAQVSDDRPRASAQSTDDRTPVSPETGHGRPVKGALTGHRCPPNKTCSNKTHTTTPPDVASELSPRDNEENLVALLTREGMPVDAARSLVRGFPDRIRPQIENLARQNDVQNRPAWLRRAIERNFRPGKFPAPGEFEPEARRTVIIAGTVTTFKTVAEARAATAADLRRKPFPGAGKATGT